MVSLPPLGMASRALTARFMMTCSRRPGIGLHRIAATAAGMVTSSMSSPIRRRSIFSICMTRSLTWTVRGSSGCRRLKASNWWVSAPPRSAERRISSSAVRWARLQIAAGEQHVAVAGDDGEQVVEIVGHAAGQPAHRLHLLRLAELLLQAGALAPHLGRADFALHGGVQPHEVGAGQMVGRAGLEHRQDVRILDLAGDHDQRQIDTLAMDGMERR